MEKVSSLRWILLATGIVAIIGLTGMNVYSLYALRDQTIESQKENKKLQVTEFADNTRRRFIHPFRGLSSIDMDKVEQHFKRTGQFPSEALRILHKASSDSIYEGIYFLPSDIRQCRDLEAFLKFNTGRDAFIPSEADTEIICDGMGMARTRMRVLMDEYKFNNKVIFDTHRSMTLALVNTEEREVIGYLTMPVNQQYLTEHYLQPKLQEKFGSQKQSGINVWLRDWTRNKDKIIASSDPSVAYDSDRIQFKHQFPDFFDDWYLAVAFAEDPLLAAASSSLIKNLVVLGAAFFLLLGALVFMFINAQRERELARRQAGFLANVTHELKTPLAVMQAAGENLAAGRVDKKERLKSYGEHIYNESIRLRRMIEKLLDVAKTDANQAKVEAEPVYLSDILRRYLDKHASYIEEKGFTLETEISDDIPMTMMDVENFETIVGNLIENALKYSKEEKRIRIELKQEGDRLRLSVADRGVGISRHSLKHIFEKFYRAEDTLTANTKGHGLGLSIVKNLVELNGGTIEVNSKEDEGSSFIIYFSILDDAEFSEEPKTDPTEIKHETQEA